MSELPLFPQLSISQPQAENLHELANSLSSLIAKDADCEELFQTEAKLTKGIKQWRTAENLAGLNRILGRELDKEVSDWSYFSEHRSLVYELKEKYFSGLNDKKRYLDFKDSQFHDEFEDWLHFESKITVSEQVHEKENLARLLNLLPSFFGLAEEIAGDLLLLPWQNADLREKVLLNLSEDCWGQMKERERLFYDLFICRDKIAKAHGFPHYYAYVSAREAQDEFSLEEREVFLKNVVDKAASIWQEVIRLRNLRFPHNLNSLSDYFLLIPEGEQFLSFNDAEINKQLITALSCLSCESGDAIAEFINKGYISYRCNSLQGKNRVTVPLPDEETIFLTFPIHRELTTFPELYYHLGEALSEFRFMKKGNCWRIRENSFTSKKILAQLVFLRCEPLLKDIYDNKAELISDLDWAKQLMTLPLALARFELESFIYSQDDVPDLSEVDEKWRELRSSYFPSLEIGEDGFFSRGKGWQYFLSDGTRPFSSLASSLAMVTVLSSIPLVNSSTKIKKAFEKFLDVDGILSLRERLEYAGLSSPLELKNIEKAFFQLCVKLEL